MFVQYETKSLYLQRKRYNGAPQLSHLRQREQCKLKDIGDFDYEKIYNVPYGVSLAPRGKCRRIRLPVV